MTNTDNPTVLRRAIERFSNPQSRARYFELYDPSCVLHGYPGVAPGLDGIKAFYAAFWAAFPDVLLTLDDVLAEGNRVAARFSFTATHLGEFMGVKATGRRVTGTGITILEFKQGRCVERWSETNTLALLQQLGAIPE